MVFTVAQEETLLDTVGVSYETIKKKGNFLQSVKDFSETGELVSRRSNHCGHDMYKTTSLSQ